MSWPLVKLADIANVVTGATPKKRSEYYDGDVPFVTPGDLGKISGITSTSRTLTQEGADSVRSIPVGSVMVCCIGATIGKVGIAEKTVVTNQQINSLVVDERKAFPKYVYYYCTTLKEKLKAASSSTTIPIVNKSNFSQFEIPLPPIDEQKWIAAILDKADVIRQKRKQAIALADEFLRSVFLDMFGDPVTNPKGWEVKPVGELVKCIVPGRDKPKSFTGEMPWITTNDLQHLGTTTNSDKGLGLSDEEISAVKARIIPKGSVLMTCVGDLGIISLAGNDLVMNQQLHAFLNSEYFEQEFLMFTLSFQKQYMLKMASSTTVPYMNKTVCNSVPVIVPTLKLQQQFKKIYLNTVCITGKYQNSKCDKLNLFNYLSQKAFSGQL
ncbi:restriction endonuclease subunit S [Photobacterium phosphoreum]|uniref:restriction endonuclease subunit S n=1 Tax=Photobacterium phosphoreum TaxID=659 RepID=UPI0024B79841|nr:restriction endonuclease subunit S [Photobacterium phosphoreum]